MIPSLKAQIVDPTICVAPGVYDALSALVAEQAGFTALYLSGASIAYTRFGRPDIGLVSMSEVAETVAAIAERVEAPLLVDGDTGYGNALNVLRTVRLFERAGAAGIQLEDQLMPKRCGHLAGKRLVDADEMVGKLKAALDARRDDGFAIVARTDAIAVAGLDTALERAVAYAEAGADMVFVEAPPSREAMERVVAEVGPKAPLMANMVEGGRTPLLPSETLQEIGYALVIFPGGTVRALARLLTEYFASLRRHGTTEPFRPRMHDFDGLNALIGTPEMLALGQRYDPTAGEES